MRPGIVGAKPTTDSANSSTDGANSTTDVTNSTTDVTNSTTNVTNSTTDVTNSTTDVTKMARNVDKVACDTLEIDANVLETNTNVSEASINVSATNIAGPEARSYVRKTRFDGLEAGSNRANSSADRYGSRRDIVEIPFHGQEMDIDMPRARCSVVRLHSDRREIECNVNDFHKKLLQEGQQWIGLAVAR